MNTWDPKSTIDSLGIGKKEKKRPARIADVIRNELSILLIRKVRDPDLAGVALSRVLVTDDLKYAKIYYTVQKSGKGVPLAGKALERAKGFMRSYLAKTLNLRYTPALQFFYDETVEKVEEVEKLFREIALENKDNEDS
jgi:ribosome-binding factor A